MKTGSNIKLLALVYFTFLKLGAISFGGGYAMVPLIEHEAVTKKKWLDKEKIIDIFAISESLPGAIGLNSSALVGYNVSGIPGALTAIFGNLTPSVIIVLTLSILFIKFSTYGIVQSAFNGIRPAIIGLITYAAYKIARTAIKDTYCIILAIAAFTAMMFIHMHPLLVIASGAVSGIIPFCVKNLVVSKKPAENINSLVEEQEVNLLVEEQEVNSLIMDQEVNVIDTMAKDKIGDRNEYSD